MTNFKEAHKTIVNGLLVYVACDDVLRYKVNQRPDGLFEVRHQSLSGGYWGTVQYRGKARQAAARLLIEEIEQFIEGGTE